MAYLEDQRLAEAETEITRALELDPKNALARNTLGVLLLDQHRITEARAAMLAAADVNTMSAPMFYSNYAFASLYEPHLSNPDVLEIHKEFGRRYASAVPDTTKPHRNDRSCDRKLRLAYLSSDFRAHSVAYFFEALLEKHDRSRFEILLYSDTTRKDVVTDAMRAGADQWIETGGLVTDVFARRLVADKIDILVNLGGHTSGNRLPACALKPAPVQIEYLDYPETSGVTAMQYRLVDAQTDPIGVAEQWCTEELVRIAGLLPLLSSPRSCARRGAAAVSGQWVHHLYVVQCAAEGQRPGHCRVGRDPAGRSQFTLSAEVQAVARCAGAGPDPRQVRQAAASRRPAFRHDRFRAVDLRPS